MSQPIKLTHLRSRLSLEVDWVWGHQPTSHLALNDKKPKKNDKTRKYQTRPEHIRQTKFIRAPQGPGSGPPPHDQEYSPNSSILELTPQSIVHSA